MKIGCFGRPIGLKGGIGRYTRELFDAMFTLAPHHEYILYTNRNGDIPIPEHGRVRHGPGGLGRIGWEQFIVPIQLFTDRPDVYHSTDFTLPVLSPFRSVVTVHDLIYLRQPEGTSLRAQMLYRILTGLSVRRAAHLIAVSQYTAQDVSSEFNIPEERITAIPLGANQDLKNRLRDGEQGRILETLGIQGRYVLFVGLLTRRKGVNVLIEAFESANQHTHLEHLVLVGGEGTDYGDVERRVERSPLSSRILLTGPVDDRALAALYSEATLLCLPSVHEGFGLPLVEAMMMACPVAASNVTSLPEVVGDAGFLAAPDDVDSWSEIIVKVSEDEALREDLKAAGLKRSEMFTWENAARRTLEVYAKVANET